MKTLGVLILSLATGWAAAPAPDLGTPGDVPALLAELKAQRDESNPDRIRELANLKTPEALAGLFEVYETMQSVYMRRIVLQGVALYDGVAGSEQKALQKMLDVATDSPDRELRLAAVELLAGCHNFGKAFLAMIVDSAADDEVRERAMFHHTSQPRKEDADWYGRIYDPPDVKEPKDGKKRGKDKEEVVRVPHTLDVLRQLAFDALASSLAAEKVLAAVKDRDPRIRRRALEELAGRGDENAAPLARTIFLSQGELAPVRVAAAKILALEEGSKVAEEFLELGIKPETPEELSMALAEFLSGMDDGDVRKLLLKGFGKGKESEQLFFLRACKKIEDEKLDKALLKVLKERDPRLLREAIELCGVRRVADALDDLKKLIERSKDVTIVSDALDATSAIRKGDAAWEKELLGYAKHSELEVRNAALEVLGRTKNPDYLPALVEAIAHEQWSTRLAAARGLEKLAMPEAVGALCARMEHEEGRMAFDLSTILWRLTGKSFRTTGWLWAKWWTEEGASSWKQPLSESDLVRLEREEAINRLKTVYRTSFFGIRIQSHRVLFILDISGSMNEPTRGQFTDKKGPTRIDVAKSELIKCLDGLDKESLFNLVVFSSAAAAWRESINELTGASLEDAKAYVSKLGADGGTNLHGALRLAFSDPEVDTIFVLSDGEPSVGSLIDPAAIRSEVAAWNEHRNVVINCIAVGGQFQILEWLAGDTGGSYVKIP